MSTPPTIYNVLPSVNEVDAVGLLDEDGTQIGVPDVPIRTRDDQIVTLLIRVADSLDEIRVLLRSIHGGQ